MDNLEAPPTHHVPIPLLRSCPQAYLSITTFVRFVSIGYASSQLQRPPNMSFGEHPESRGRIAVVCSLGWGATEIFEKGIVPINVSF